MIPLFHSLFFSTHPSPTSTYTLSLHDALPIYCQPRGDLRRGGYRRRRAGRARAAARRSRARARAATRDRDAPARSEEHTSELQSRRDLVCRLLLEKKKINIIVRK